MIANVGTQELLAALGLLLGVVPAVAAAVNGWTPKDDVEAGARFLGMVWAICGVIFAIALVVLYRAILFSLHVSPS